MPYGRRGEVREKNMNIYRQSSLNMFSFQVISMLPPDQQPVAVVNLERAKEHSPQELMMLPQMMGPLSGMSGIHGMPMGLPMPPPMVPTPIEKRQQSESPAFKRPKFENELEIDVKSDGASDSNNSSPEFVKVLFLFFLLTF